MRIEIVRPEFTDASQHGIVSPLSILTTSEHPHL